MFQKSSRKYTAYDRNLKCKICFKPEKGRQKTTKNNWPTYQKIICFFKTTCTWISTIWTQFTASPDNRTASRDSSPQPPTLTLIAVVWLWSAPWAVRHHKSGCQRGRHNKTPCRSPLCPDKSDWCLEGAEPSYSRSHGRLCPPPGTGLHLYSIA